MFMLILMEGYEQEILLSGKRCTLTQLREQYRHAKHDPIIWCMIYRFQQLPYDEAIEVDFVIDTDTGRIYKPRY